MYLHWVFSNERHCFFEKLLMFLAQIYDMVKKVTKVHKGKVYFTYKVVNKDIISRIIRPKGGAPVNLFCC